MILSDRDLRIELEAGRVVVEPLGPDAIQPSSIDLRIGRQFRIFANTRYPYIDVRKPMDDLTELVEVTGDEPFILHPGEFVLGTTLERVAIPDDLVGRLEGKSSLGRLGLLIHSSLPAGEEVLFLADDGKLGWKEIGDLVRKTMTGCVVAFDPRSLVVGYHRVTGWYEGPADTIFEVRLASGRRVRVTAGHNLFTLGRSGEIHKIRTAELQPSTMVAVPRRIPDPPVEVPVIDVLDVIPERLWPSLTVEGEPVQRLFERQPTLARALVASLSIDDASYYSRNARLPVLAVAQMPALLSAVRRRGRVTVQGSPPTLPTVLPITADLAWLFGLYLAEGRARPPEVTFGHLDREILERVEAILERLGQPADRRGAGITASSAIFSLLMLHYGFGARVRSRRVPPGVLGWPTELLQAFLDGFGDGGGSPDAAGFSWGASSGMLAGDLLVLTTRLGGHPAASPGGLGPSAAAGEAGHGPPTGLGDLEQGSDRDAVRTSTWARLATKSPGSPHSAQHDSPARLIEGDLAWDSVVEVVRSDPEPIFDISVRPTGRRIENFLAGRGGVFVSNTAGFVDAGFTGNLTLELSNVANLPITLYPGMKIGQISLFRMTSPAEKPYGSDRLGSKYLDQEGPTPSRYWENFEADPDDPNSK